MFKLAKGRMSIWAVVGAVLFMIVQVTANLNIPSLTSDIVNNGVVNGDIDYIWHVGMKMIGFSLLSIAAAASNVFIASRASMKLGYRLRNDIYGKVIIM